LSSIIHSEPHFHLTFQFKVSQNSRPIGELPSKYENHYNKKYWWPEVPKSDYLRLINDGPMAIPIVHTSSVEELNENHRRNHKRLFTFCIHYLLSFLRTMHKSPFSRWLGKNYRSIQFSKIIMFTTRSMNFIWHGGIMEGILINPSHLCIAYQLKYWKTCGSGMTSILLFDSLFKHCMYCYTLGKTHCCWRQNCIWKMKGRMSSIMV
jgi:hypothetical protein